MNDRMQIDCCRSARNLTHEFRLAATVVPLLTLVATMVAQVGLNHTAYAQVTVDQVTVDQVAGDPAVSVDQIGDELPPGATLRMGTIRFCSPDGVMQFYMTQDERTLVSFGRWIMGWDVATGKELWRAESPIGYLPASYGMRPITAQADGEHFLLAGNDGTISRWHARSGKREASKFAIPVDEGMGRFGAGCRAIDQSSTGKHLFVGNAFGFKVVDASGNLQFEVSQSVERPDLNERDRLTFGGPYAYGRFSPDGSALAVTMSSQPKSIQIYDVTTGQPTAELECQDSVVRLEFSPNGKSLAATERDTSVRLYNVDDGSRIWEHSFDVDKRSENYSSALAFTPDGKRLAVCERNQQIFIMNVETGEEAGIIRNHSWNPWAVTFSSDNDTLFSSGWGGTIHRWSINRLEPLPLPLGISGTSVATTSSDGRQCAYVDQDGVIRLVTTTDGQETGTLQVPNGVFEILEFSRDATKLAAGGPWNGNLHILVWDLASRRVEQEWNWKLGNDPVTGVEEIRFSRDDSKLAVAVFRQSAAHLIDLDTGIRKRLAHRSIYGLSFTADDKQLITAGWDKQLRRWDTATGKLLGEHRMPNIGGNDDPRMYTVCCDPLSGHLATAQMNAQIRTWNVDDFSPVRQWDSGSSFSYGSMRFSPDGLWLASGDASGRILVWDPSTGEQLHVINAHEDSVYLVTFGKDNRTICTGGANLGYFWSLRPQSLGIDDLSQAIEALCNESGTPSYHAWWYLVEHGDAAVDPVLEVLNRTTEVYDIDAHLRKSSKAQRERREALLRKAAASSPTTLTKRGLRNLVSVLSHIDTPRSLTALQALASPDDPVGRQALWEVRRRATLPASSLPQLP